MRKEIARCNMCRYVDIETDSFEDGFNFWRIACLMAMNPLEANCGEFELDVDGK